MLMLKTATVLEAISKRRRTARPAAHAGPSKNAIFAATHSAEDTLVLLDATAGGLTAEHAAERLSAVGPNTIEAPTKTLARRIADAFIDPFAGILAALALVSLYIDVLAVPEPQRDPSTVIVIGIMLLVSGGMKFIQEARSGNAAEALKDLVSNTCCALRDGERIEIPFDELVPGDVIRLSAGDMVPADARIITARDLFVIESALTGESEAVEKTAAAAVVEGADSSALPLSACKNIVFTGTSVQNGTAMALVVATGSDTYLGGIAKMLNGRGEKSAFDRGVSSVSMLLVRLMLVMAPAVFAINAATKGNVIDALLFATSVAVGITPQMLPVIVTTSLSQGAKDLARRQVIVKELPAIQNLGAMDVLCCDKTGTLTEDRIVLERYLNTDGNEDARVLRHAFLNSFFQTGLKNLIDLAVIDRADVTPSAAAPDSMLGQSLRDRYTKVDEVPFDFSRRRLSVAVADAQGKTQMVTKGAAEEMLEICSFVEVDGAAQPLTKDKLAQIRKQVAGLNAEGLRVIAVAQKTNPRCVGEFGIADECDMVLMGFLAFLDPPKASAAGVVATLEAKGVAVKVLTGDTTVSLPPSASKSVSTQATSCWAPRSMRSMTPSLPSAPRNPSLAKLSPLQKARLVRVMRELLGHTVGFMGDGINDAAAMRASDCGISVDSAVDIAKESADIILLQKDLGVLERGIIEGRRTYGNLLKYLKTTVSSNFGNVLSVTVASLFLPFLPMSALQLVLLSLVYEIVCIELPWDTVDDVWTARPRAWDAASIKGFMLELGPVSSLFDIVTFAALFFVVCPAAVDASWAELAAAGDVAGMAAFAALFQSGWFVESMWSQTLVIHILRSPRLPSPRDHAAPALCVLTVLGLALVTWLPASPIADALGLMPLPTSFFALLIGIVGSYIALTQLAKRRYIARHGELL